MYIIPILQITQYKIGVTMLHIPNPSSQGLKFFSY